MQTPQMTKSASRPIVLTIFCVLAAGSMFYRLGIAIVYAASYEPQRLAYIIVHKLVVLVAIVGLWRLRSWGVALYVTTQVATTVLYFAWPPTITIPPSLVLGGLAVGLAIFAAVTLPFWKRFS